METKTFYYNPGFIPLPEEDGIDFRSDIEEQVQTGIVSSQEYNESSLEQTVESNHFYNQNQEAVNGTDLAPVNCLPINSKMKEDVDFQVKIESDSSQEHNEPCQEQFAELNEYYNHYINDNGSDTVELNVPLKCSPSFSKIEDEVNFNVKKEEKVKIETYCNQEQESHEIQHEKMESDDNSTMQMMKNYVGTESDNKEADVRVEEGVYSKVEIEENFKIEIDRHQEEYEVIEEQLVKEEENIGNTDVERNKDTEKKIKRIAKDSRKNKFKLKTPQHPMTSSDDFRRQRENEEYTNIQLHLERHPSSVHLKECKFECHLCDYTPKQKSNLDKHIRFVHLKECKFECHLCDYTAQQKSNLDRHIRFVHLNERRFECHLCEYKANQKSHLNNHLRTIHLNEREFQCNLCEYKATTQTHLNIHVSSVHLKERKFECHLCEYKANQKMHLNDHLSAIHFKERKFACHLCEYKANIRLHLKRHLTTVHMKERKFECHLCEYRGKHKWRLNNHLRSAHSKERKFECHLCEYKAKQKTNLKRHVKCVHLEELKF